MCTQCSVFFSLFLCLLHVLFSIVVFVIGGGECLDDGIESEENGGEEGARHLVLRCMCAEKCCKLQLRWQNKIYLLLSPYCHVICAVIANPFKWSRAHLIQNIDERFRMEVDVSRWIYYLSMSKLYCSNFILGFFRLFRGLSAIKVDTFVWCSPKLNQMKYSYALHISPIDGYTILRHLSGQWADIIGVCRWDHQIFSAVSFTFATSHSQCHFGCFSSDWTASQCRSPKSIKNWNEMIRSIGDSICSPTQPARPLQMPHNFHQGLFIINMVNAITHCLAGGSRGSDGGLIGDSGNCPWHIGNCGKKSGSWWGEVTAFIAFVAFNSLITHSNAKL